MDLIGRLIPPKKTGDVPSQSQWLTGEGGGAWFYIQPEGENFRIKRYTPEGELDCDRIFRLSSPSVFKEEEPFEMQHISHCAIVRIKQHGIVFEFHYIT